MAFTKLRNIILYIITILFAIAYTHSNEADSLRKSRSTSYPLITKEDSLNTIKSFQKEVDRIIKAHKLKNTSYSLIVYSLDNYKTMYSRNTDKLLTPASVTKLFTSFSALSNLGKDYQINTSVYADTIPKDSVLDGNLYIVGHGDALLSLTDIELLAAQIYESGIRKINGNVYSDASYFDPMTSRKKYSGDKDKVENLQHITALSVEKNTATILVNSASKPGSKVNVQIIPPSDGFSKTVSAKVRGNVKSKKKSVKTGYIDTDPDRLIFDESRENIFGDALPDPIPRRRRSTIKVSSKMLDNGLQHFTVSGYLSYNRSYSYRYFLRNPALVVAGVLKNRLESFGITISGKISSVAIPSLDSNIVLREMAHYNRPLTEIIYFINKDSDNYLAETLFKMLGAYSGNYEDNGAGSRLLTFNKLKSLGIDCENCKLNDGSGLSRRNKVTAQAILGILKHTFKSEFRSELDSSLSIAGIDGTLKKRMSGTAAEANLRAKTGTLRNVSALSGYVNTLDNENLAFAFIFNGWQVGTYKQIENELGRLMAEFFYFNEEI